MAPVSWQVTHTGTAYTSPEAYTQVAMGPEITLAELKAHFANLTADKVTPAWESKLSDMMVRIARDNMNLVLDDLLPWCEAMASGLNCPAHRLQDGFLVTLIEQQHIRAALRAEEQNNNKGLEQAPFKGEGKSLQPLANWARAIAYSECHSFSTSLEWSSYVLADESVHIDLYKHTHLLNTTYHNAVSRPNYCPALGEDLDSEKEPPDMRSVLLISNTPLDVLSMTVSAIGTVFQPNTPFFQDPLRVLEVLGHPAGDMRYVRRASDAGSVQQLQQQHQAQLEKLRKQHSEALQLQRNETIKLQKQLQASNQGHAGMEADPVADAATEKALLAEISALQSKIPADWTNNSGVHTATLTELAVKSQELAEIKAKTPAVPTSASTPVATAAPRLAAFGQIWHRLHQQREPLAPTRLLAYQLAR